ncbi:MAG: hypothetical protein U9Q78_00635 [Chloroflexota bacterium]|nr:hypothetical protein [Chloroflexota bacterium]
MTIVSTICSVVEGDVRAAVELFAEYGPQGVAVRDVIHMAVMSNGKEK